MRPHCTSTRRISGETFVCTKPGANHVIHQAYILADGADTQTMTLTWDDRPNWMSDHTKLALQKERRDRKEAKS